MSWKGVAGYVTGQLRGTSTNDNAGLGNVGQIIESTILTASAVPATSATPVDITSVSLTAGDWDVWGSIVTKPAAGTTTSEVAGWISATSATVPTAPNAGAQAFTDAALGANGVAAIPVGMRRVSVATTTPVFLSAQLIFAISTMAVYGYIGARRVR